MNTFDGYIRRDGTNSKVLLDGGDAKALSSFIGTLSYNNNKITYTKADGSTSYDLVTLEPNITSTFFVGNSTDSSTTITTLTNGNVYLHFKEGNSESKFKVSGLQNITVTTDASGNIIITGPDLSGLAVSENLNNYLPLTGGVLLSNSQNTPLHIKSYNGVNSYIGFLSNTGSYLGYYGFENSVPKVYIGETNGYTVLHSGNSNISNGVITINGSTITPITSLSGYATEQFVTNKLSSVLDIKIVPSLPTTDINTKTLYLMSAGSTGTNDLYKEYVYINKGTEANPNWDWEILGTVHLNYSDLVTALSFSNNKLQWTKGSTAQTGIEIGYASYTSSLQRTSIADSSGLLMYSGQFTYNNKAKAGSYGDYSIWSYPDGGSHINYSDNNPISVNLMGIRLYWTSTYFHDLLFSPNNSFIYYRNVFNSSPSNWFIIPKYQYIKDNTSLGSSTNPVYINSSGEFTTCDSYPTKASWNYDDVYLKLSGGNMTGTIKWSNTNKDINANDWNIYELAHGIEILNSIEHSDRGAYGSYDTALHVGGYYWFQIDFSKNDNYLHYRGGNDEGTQRGWYTLLDSGNYSTWCASATHTHNYLPLSGGTMTGIITRDAGGAWISGRDNAIIKTTRISNEGSDWHPAVAIKTSLGCWTFGSVGGESLCLSYDTDTNYNNSHNDADVINFPSAGSTGTLALTSQIPTKSSWNYDDVYLKLSGGTMTGDLTTTGVTASGTSNRLIFRHLDGLNCDGDYALYLQYYNSGYPIYLGGSTYSISNYGSYYNGTSQYAKNISAYNYEITVNGDSNTYYPVVIGATYDKTKLNYISVWKNLGTTTAFYPHNHRDGTSSMWLIIEGRTTAWDGNEGYFKTIYKKEEYATLVAEATPVYASVAVMCIYLRGGGTTYNISTSYETSVNIYYSRTDIRGGSYPAIVEPRTTIGNGGIIYGTYYGYITYASYLSEIIAEDKLPARFRAYGENTSSNRNTDSTNRENGFYWSNTGTMPANVGDIDIITVNANDSYGHQLGFKFSGNGTTGSSYDGKDLYTRIFSGGSYLPWYTIYTSGNTGWNYSSQIRYEPHTRKFVCTKGYSSWDVQFYSTDCYVTDVEVSFKIGQRNCYVMIGLNSDPTTNASYNSIDYSWYPNGEGSVEIYENGSHIGNWGAYSVGDEFAINYSGGFVRYYWNGTLIRTVSRSKGSKLYADASFYNDGNVYDVWFGKKSHESVGEDNQAINALLHSGIGRSDNESGSTWLFVDDASGYSSTWGIKHNQPSNYIEYYGGGSRNAWIDLGSGTINTNYRYLVNEYVGNYHSNNNISGYAGEIWFGGNFHIDSQNGQYLYLNYYSQYDTFINPRGGNVGIGTVSPSYKLHVIGDIYANGGWLRSSGSTGWYNESYGGGIYMSDSDYVRTYGTKRFYVDYSGDLAIYTAGGFASAKSGGLFAIYNGSSWYTDCLYNHWNGNLSIDAPGGSLYISYSRGNTYFSGGSYYIDRSGNTYFANYYSTSDRSKKQNISTFSEHIRKFQMKDTEKWHYGVIAQEVEEMFRDGEEGNMTVNYNSVLSYYVGKLENEVKELREEIKELKSKLYG